MTDSDLAAPRPGAALRLAIGLCLAAVLGLGLWPGPLVESATRASQSLLSRPTASAAAEAATIARR
jgi:hypothetical protein